MADLVSIQNTFGAGQRQKSALETSAQNREFNSLRASGERQRQDIQQRTFDAETQRANTFRLLNGVRLAQENPSVLPQVGQELVGAGILNQSELPGLLQRAQTDPETFRQGLEDFESQLMFALSEAPKTREDRKILTGADKLNRFVDTGEQVFKGVEAPTGTAAAGAAERFFGSLTADLTAEQQADAKLIQLGLAPRAVGSANITIAEDEQLTEDVAESQATIAQRKKFGEATGASRAKLIDKGFETIQKIDVNLLNLDKAITAIDEGASTGAVESRFFPTIRKSTVALEQIQKQLGLDVIGGVTFGALSKGELDLALAVALPTGLQPAELKQWISDKRAAQEKLRAYYASQIDFLDQGGTVAAFLRQQERGVQQTEQSGGEAPEGTVITNAQGRSFIKQNGQWVPNG